MSLPTWLIFIFAAIMVGMKNEIHANETKPFPVYGMREIEFKDGVAKATSKLDNNWNAAKAFMKQIPEEQGWHVAENTKNLPVMIWYDFGEKYFFPARVSVQPAQKGYIQRAPTSFEFLGSNDVDCNEFTGVWTILCQDLSDTPYRNLWDTKYCHVEPGKVNEKFKCLGIRVLKNRHTDGWTSLRNIRMWEFFKK